MNELARELDDLGGADITAALDELPVHAFLLDTNGTVLWHNRTSRQVLGPRLGRDWVDVMTEQSIRATDRVWQQMLRSGTPVEVTVELVLPDGTSAGRDVSVAPLREGGSIIGVFGIGVPLHELTSEPERLEELGLTPRQVEILQLLAEGKSTEQIAVELYISKTTVRNHVSNLLANLGVHSRVQAVILASRAGLIKPSD